MSWEVNLEFTLLLKDIKAYSKKSILNPVIPAFVIMGKSNVGKSTLLNGLLKTKIARHGKTPGLTTFIQVFKINQKGQDFFYIIDCPGFGYAQGGKARERQLQELVLSFLDNWQEQISSVLFLMDIRRYSQEKGSKKEDPEDRSRDMFWLSVLSDLEIPTLIVTTKVDKLSKNKQREAIHGIAKNLEIDPEDIFAVSALKKTGVNDLLQFLINHFIRKPN